ncbi:MAG TPA: M15 family metallopeptidase [Frankiaceae bacterium]|nr:M15 family metallopeptidase [Frankiaceae bacterium]
MSVFTSIRPRLLIVPLLLLVALIASCTPAPNPISPANHPTTVAGQRDGYLPASVLYTQGPLCKAYRQAAGSLVAMLAAARRDGVNLAPEECYRDYAGQVYWRQYWCAHGACGNAAIPGTSNHGWGKAVDLRDQFGELTHSSPGYRWMRAHAGSWGWNQPANLGEAWHWEWVGDGGTLHGYTVHPELFGWAAFR